MVRRRKRYRKGRSSRQQEAELEGVDWALQTLKKDFEEHFHPAAHLMLSLVADLSRKQAKGQLSPRHAQYAMLQVQKTMEVYNKLIAAYKVSDDLPPLLKHDIWTQICGMKLTHADPKALNMLAKASQGKLPPQHDLPRDPYSRYIEHLDLAGVRAAADLHFSLAELHDMFEARHGHGAQAQDAFAIEAFIKSGANSFVVSRYLQDLFCVQDLNTHGLPGAPYEGMWFQTPYSGLKFYSAKTGNLVEADGFYVVDYEHPRVGHCILINLWAAEEPDAECHGYDATLGVRIENPFSLGQHVESTVDRIEVQLRNRQHIPHREQHAETLAAAFRMYFHVLLYLDADLAVARDLYASELERVRAILASRTTPGARKATRKQREEAKKRLRQIPKAKVHLLAPALVKGEPTSPKRFGEKRAGERKRTIVRGHYRMQPYGPRDQHLRRRIHIAPHFSPKLEGDDDLNVLLRSTEYVLE